MNEPATDLWLGRADLAWNILLVAAVSDLPPAPVLRERLSVLYGEQGWGPADGSTVVEGDAPGVLDLLARRVDVEHPISLGLAPGTLVVRGHHPRVDGLGLLGVLRDVAAGDLVSLAKGVGDRRRRLVLSTFLSRVVEAVLRPPAAVGTAGPAPSAGDVFAVRRLDRTVRTHELAHAAVQAVVGHNERVGGRSDRIAVAIGVSTSGGRRLRIADDSGFLRITRAERLDLSAMRRRIGEARLQVGGTARSGMARWAAPLIRWASASFSTQLGSTLLVSHLGRVESADVTGLAFYPLAGNGSGLSVGAVTLHGGTTITLRARSSRHSPGELDRLLDAIAASLTRES